MEKGWRAGEKSRRKRGGGRGRVDEGWVGRVYSVYGVYRVYKQMGYLNTYTLYTLYIMYYHNTRRISIKVQPLCTLETSSDLVFNALFNHGYHSIRPLNKYVFLQICS